MISQPWRKPASATVITGLVYLSIRNMLFSPPVAYLLKRKPLASKPALKCKFYLHSTTVKMFRLYEAARGASRALQTVSISNVFLSICPLESFASVGQLPLSLKFYKKTHNISCLSRSFPPPKQEHRMLRARQGKPRHRANKNPCQ